MDLISKIEDLKNFGIDLKLDSEEMEIFYVKSLRYFFEEKEDLYCIQISDLELEISDAHELLASVFIKDSILRIIPLGQNPYAVLMDVLEFVANLHKPTIELFKQTQNEKKKIEPVKSKTLKETTNKPDFEEDSDFDDDWI